jgi:hypothetical protein
MNLDTTKAINVFAMAALAPFQSSQLATVDVHAI